MSSPPKKYEITTERLDTANGSLFRIRALRDIERHQVKTGDLGGWIAAEKNLSQTGDAWVSENARVSGDACVSGYARVFGDVQVFGNARVSGDAWVFGNAWVFGDALVFGNARVSGHARIFEDAKELDPDIMESEEE